MNCIVPYTKEIKFDTKIKEILSISLEHEMNYANGEILGNFIVSGEYKAHELSVNKEDFSYTLPFSIDVGKNVIDESVTFDITDFSYEILNDNVLKVMIEGEVSAKEIEETIIEEPLFEEVKDKEEELTVLERDNVLEEYIEKEHENVIEKEKNEIVEIIEEKKEIPDHVANTISKAVDSYKTYHIHIVKENETVESICLKYKTNKSLLEEYNDIKEITIGDKLIIPEDD